MLFCVPNSDRWNHFDILVILVFFCVILPLRIFTLVTSESVTNNRVLVVAGYLYGFNTMFLTVRVFGQMLETIEGIGAIQIALFHIIKDVIVVVVHFIAIRWLFQAHWLKYMWPSLRWLKRSPLKKRKWKRLLRLINPSCFFSNVFPQTLRCWI